MATLVRLPASLPTMRIGSTFANEPAFIRTQMDGGATIQQRRLVNPSSIVNGEWILSQDQLDILEAFYHFTLKEGTLSFLMDALTPFNSADDEVKFTQPYSTNHITNNPFPTFSVSARLEVVNLARSQQAANVLINTGLTANQFFLDVDRMYRFLHVTWPTTIPWEFNW